MSEHKVPASEYESWGMFIKDEDAKESGRFFHGPAMMGWVCPVCGRGLSPFTSICPCKGGIRYECGA